jgi:AcrR family transcriptional regulator
MARKVEPWRRERLLDAALVAMSERGGGGLRLKDIAEAAGVSNATIHYHFDDIEGVFAGVLERAFQQFYTARLEAIESTTSLPEKLSQMIDFGVPDVPSVELEMLYEGIAMIRGNPDFVPLVNSYMTQQADLYRAVIDAGIHAQCFTPLERSPVIARNIVALEDAYCMYLTLNLDIDGAQSRANIRSYAESTLQVSLPARDETS